MIKKLRKFFLEVGCEVWGTVHLPAEEAHGPRQGEGRPPGEEQVAAN